jgi:hypothetical protein
LKNLGVLFKLPCFFIGFEDLKMQRDWRHLVRLRKFKGKEFKSSEEKIKLTSFFSFL